MIETAPLASSLAGSTVAVSGATGLVGTALTDQLQSLGASVLKLTRRPPRDAGEVQWDAKTGVPDPSRLEGVGAVVHLAGESIADGRWTTAKKQRIRDSRVTGTRVLCEALARLTQRPATLVCASAIGYYGDRGAEHLDETSEPGLGFLPNVCREWEAATSAAAQAGIRVVNTRLGVVLSAKGGALTKMLLPFRMGVGGKIGPGTQYMSWVALADVVGTILHALTQTSLSGPVNTVAPEPVTNAEFTKTLGKVLGVWTVFPLPAFAARLALGQMADDLLLASARVHPRKLQETDYQFHFPTLEACLRAELAKPTQAAG